MSKLVRKYLPPGTVMELYQHFLGWCAANAVSLCSQSGCFKSCLLFNMLYLFGVVLAVHCCIVSRLFIWIAIGIHRFCVTGHANGNLC